MREQMKKQLQCLTLKQKIGQMLVGQAEGTELSDDFRTFLTEYPIAGYRMNGPNIRSCEQVKRLTADIQQAYEENGLNLPVIFAADQETGTLSVFGRLMTEFPGNMALAAADDLQLTRAQGQAVGWELAEMGVNHLLAPVADVNLETNNPVIGVRSFGDDPHRVAKQCINYVQGVHVGGVAASAKHFPGHGNTKTDTHADLAINGSDVKTLMQTEFVPFRQLADHHVDSVMVSHVIFSNIDSRPSSLSKRVITGLLREEMGYEGLVISDDLAMGAIRKQYSAGEAVLQFILAGGDIAFIHDGRRSVEEAFDRLMRALKQGELTEERINQSVARILLFKHKINDYNRSRQQPKEDSRLISRKVSEQSVTLLRDPKKLLPVPGESRVLLVLPRTQNLTEADTSGDQENLLFSYLQKFVQDVRMLEFTLDEDWDYTRLNRAVSDRDLIIYCTVNAHRFPAQISAINHLKRCRPLVAVMLRDPYDAQLISEDITVVAAYSIIDEQMRTLAKQLGGKIPFVGKCPVQIC
ncbi:glycoside hydrolase family 3 protein [Paenactinomyces guangxiensis]|uniref:beta-N-acetylhexosaminidase n=1 Tax=Paenactinomyces guangxiensis TaxID=1490290 RepID=A0A7W1WN83_9BACL|nr:glycoside hydrolase family 3 protein [Paenactinomyces guangxiensis]MBA4492868.1 glycoside hydrolase family 3 protein [Paenactinomyces guangxiensis]MBH8590283.1 glycoside hydrolase family 3 protein [Paenactinomyces guangxiensis]